MFLRFVSPQENTVLLDLNISHNEFREAGGETLAVGLCKFKR